MNQIVSLYGSPPKLIVLKVSNCDNKILYAILKKDLQKAIRFLLDFNKDIIEIFPHE